MGHNSYRSESHCSSTLHVEMDGLRKLNKINKWKGNKKIKLDLIVVRYTKLGLANSAPCIDCCKEVTHKSYGNRQKNIK